MYKECSLYYSTFYDKILLHSMLDIIVSITCLLTEIYVPACNQSQIRVQKRGINLVL